MEINTLLTPDFSVLPEGSDYQKFIHLSMKLNKDCEGWLSWANTRVGDCSALLRYIPFRKHKEWTMIELGARGSAFSSYVSQYIKLIIVSDNFQIGQNKGHTWHDYNGKGGYGDLCLWNSRWKEIAINPDRLDCRRIDCCHIPFPDNYFDCIISISVIEHIKDSNGFSNTEDLKSLHGAYRVLKPGGWYGITSDFNKVMRDEQDRPKDYDEQEFVRLVTLSGFRFETGTYNYKTDKPCGGFAILRK